MQDTRYSRTEQWICDAGWKLLREKHVDKVTVQEICRCAQISRNTFYSHFLDKYELVDKLVLRFVHQITDEIPKVNQDSSFEEAITTNGKDVVFLSAEKPRRTKYLRRQPSRILGGVVFGTSGSDI